MLWLIRLISLLILFAYASWQDHRHGEVSNKVWLYTPIGFALLCYEIYLSPHLLSYSLVIATFTVVFGLVLFFAAKGRFGPADAKALMMLGLCYPLTVDMLVYPLFSLVLAGFFVGAKFLVSRGRGGLFGSVRLVPYLFAGMLTVLVLPV